MSWSCGRAAQRGGRSLGGGVRCWGRCRCAAAAAAWQARLAGLPGGAHSADQDHVSFESTEQNTGLWSILSHATCFSAHLCCPISEAANMCKACELAGRVAHQSLMVLVPLVTAGCAETCCIQLTVMLHMMQGARWLGGSGAAHPQRLRPPGHQPGRMQSNRTENTSAACPST